jgi:hypothetical protein
MICRLHALVLSALLFATPLAFAAESLPPVPPLPQEAASISKAAEIERLMVLFRVREVLKRAKDQILNDHPRFSSMPETQRECYVNMMAGEPMIEEIRQHHSTIFADPVERGQVLAFMESEIGMRLIGQIFDEGIFDKTDPLAGFSETDLAALNQFAATPGGRLFIGIQQSRLAPLQQESGLRLAQRAIKQCGPVP